MWVGCIHGRAQEVSVTLHRQYRLRTSGLRLRGFTLSLRDLYSRTTPYYAKGWGLCEKIFAAGVYVVSCYDSSVGDKRLDLC